MDLARTRRLVSGAAIAVALAGGVVAGNDLLLGTADPADPAVGQLSARIPGATAPAVTRPSTTVVTDQAPPPRPQPESAADEGAGPDD